MPIFDLKNQTHKELIVGFDAQMVHTGQIIAAHFKVSARSILHLHHHILVQISNVITGSFEMNVDGLHRSEITL